MKSAGTIVLLLSLLMLCQSVCLSAELKNLDKDYWLEVYFRGQRVGTRHRTLTRTSLNDKPVYKYEETESVRFIYNGYTTSSDYINTVYLDSTFFPILSTIKATLYSNSSDKREFSWEAAYGQESIDIKGASDGQAWTKNIPISDGTDLSTYYAFLLGDKKLSVGQKIEGTLVNVTKCALLSWECSCVGTNTVRTGGKSYDCFRIIEKCGNGQTISYVIEDCTTIKRKSPQSNEADFFVIPAQALQGVPSRTPDLTGRAIAIDTDCSLDSPEPPTSLRARLTEVPDESFAISDYRQSATFHKDGNYVEYTVTAKPFDVSKSLSLPIKDTEHAEWLKPSTGIQSDDKEIQALSREIVGDETNAHNALCKLRAWIYANINTRYASGVPLSATDVLKAKTGDCRHHTIIFTALARAAGIPTRILHGIRSTGGMFFYGHAWVEGYVGEWVSLDSTSDSNCPDATYIKLQHGDLSILDDNFNPDWEFRSSIEILEYK